MNTAKIPRNPAVRWEWIKYQLRAKGASLAKLARSLGVATQAVTNAKLTPYPRVERAIAAALEMSPDTLWPERWLDADTPKRQRPNRAETQYLIGECSKLQKNSRYAVQIQRKEQPAGV